MRFLSLAAVFALLGAGCATHDTSSISNGLIAPGSPEMAQMQDQVSKTAPPPGEAKDLNDNESDMQNLPEELNEKVTQWIEYFQGRGRPHMEKYLSRSSRYLPRMKEILRSHGLPEDLVYIALIESGFSSQALSRSRAVGYWQFIRGTGRRYGLEQNYYVDDRRDFEASTEAAAKYLKALYNLFGSWYLAIASYNVGENRIKRLVMQHYTRDFWTLAANNHLPKETVNYVPKFLAARTIAKHPQKYGFDSIDWKAPLDYKTLDVTKQGVDLTILAQQLGMDKKELFALNPAFKKGVIPKRSKATQLRVPSYFTDDKLALAVKASQSKVTMNVASGADQTYRIRRGDTLSHIASRFGTSIRELQEANNLGRRSVLYPGKRLIIPGRVKVARASATIELKNGEKQYKVRQGDSLYSIAKKFGVSISKLKDRNNIRRRSLIRVGRVLVIP